VEPISATGLRANIYGILDEVLGTGIPVEISWRGQILKIVAQRLPSRLEVWVAHDLVHGDREEPVHVDGSGNWRQCSTSTPTS
jgi:hypothetical protein